MSVGDRVVVRGTYPGKVVSLGVDGDPYVRLDQGSSALYPAADVRPATA